MNQRKKTMIALVKKEAKNLRKFAEKSELRKLNFKVLYPKSQNSCVYGQMTNNCFSDRATELIKKCCERVYDSPNASTDMSKAKLNGNPKRRIRDRFYSPIEIYITQPDNVENTNGNNKNLINYLKGKTDKLTLS